MYIFSVNAKSKKTMAGVGEKQEVHFIVHINFKDAFGAEKLCQLYLLKAGFKDVHIEKRKRIKDELLTKKAVLNAHKNLKEAVEKGYSIQLFEEP